MKWNKVSKFLKVVGKITGITFLVKGIANIHFFHLRCCLLLWEKV